MHDCSHDVRVVVFLSHRGHVSLFLAAGVIPHLTRQAQNAHGIPRINVGLSQAVQTHTAHSVAQASVIVGVLAVSRMFTSVFLVSVLFVFFTNVANFVAGGGAGVTRGGLKVSRAAYTVAGISAINQFSEK